MTILRFFIVLKQILKTEHIVATDNSLLIGVNNRLPWKCKEDLRYFKETTMCHIVVMGKNTWNSLPGKLEGRINIVLSTTMLPSKGGPDYILQNMQQLEELFINHPKLRKYKVFIAGGGKVYEDTTHLAHHVRMTDIGGDFGWRKGERPTYYQPEFKGNYARSPLYSTLVENDEIYHIQVYKHKLQSIGRVLYNAWTIAKRKDRYDNN